MKNLIIIAAASALALSSCSTVSSLMQNSFPYNTNFVIAAKTPADTELTTMGFGNSINQITGASNNVTNIKMTNATATITSNDQSIGIFKSIKVYLSNGTGSSVLVANRENIADNIGKTLALDVDMNAEVEQIMKSGNVQEKIVYTLKSAPVEELKLRISLQFSSQPIVK